MRGSKMGKNVHMNNLCVGWWASFLIVNTLITDFVRQNELWKKKVQIIENSHELWSTSFLVALCDCKPQEEEIASSTHKHIRERDGGWRGPQHCPQPTPPIFWHWDLCFLESWLLLILVISTNCVIYVNFSRCLSKIVRVCMKNIMCGCFEKIMWEEEASVQFFFPRGFILRVTPIQRSIE
jgi:hypothetical protein